MDNLIWVGAGITCLGFAGVVYSLVAVIGARRAGLSDADLRARIGRMVPVNIGALLLSFLGLVVVVTGILLG